MPAQPRPAMLLSRSSNASLLPASDTREDSPIFRASVSVGLRSSSGPKSALRTFSEKPAFGSCAHGSAVAVSVSVQTLSRDLGLEPQRCAPCPGRRTFELRRAVAGGNRAVEPEQRQRGTALLRRHFRFDAEFAVTERLEIDALDRRHRRLRGDRGGALELRRVDIDHGARVAAIGLPGTSCRARTRV